VAARGTGDGGGGIGLLGGSFNPPHLGHVAAAEQALAQLGLERVLLMPVHTQPHKGRAPDPGPEHRLAMCRLAVAGHDRLGVCDVEVQREGASYTADTLEHIRARDPHAALTFIVGADTAATIPSWRRPEDVLSLAELAIVTRPGTPIGGAGERLRELFPGARVRTLEMAPVEISSSLARSRAAAGGPLEPLVGDAVAGYIRDNALYGAATGVPAAGRP
jgi:nicotinate-nucleotide adenylyltransferase